MKYRDSDLEQALCDIANKKTGWQDRAPSICSRAMHRLTELENAWEAIRDKIKEAHFVADCPDQE